MIADAGVGAYRQSGGTATFAGKLTIANNFTASGTFALNGGSAVVRGEIDVGVGGAERLRFGGHEFAGDFLRRNLPECPSGEFLNQVNQL